MMLPTKFGVNWPFGSGEAKNNIRPFCISDQNYFSYFDVLVTPMLPIKFQDNWLFVTREEAKNSFSRWRLSLISHRNNFS